MTASASPGFATGRPLRVAWLGTVPYRPAWSLQRRLAQARRHGKISDDVLLLLEHPPVYTLGRSTADEHLGGGREALAARGADVLEVDRGGSVTFHGPGQLVAYPIVMVPDHLPLEASRGAGDVIRYVRTLEEAVIATAQRVGVAAVRRPPYTGVWVGEPPVDKLASLGVKVAGGVSTHGLALNVTTDLGWFDAITPCGIVGAGVTSLELQGADIGVAGCGEMLAASLGHLLGSSVGELDETTRSLIADHRSPREAAA